MRNNCCWSEFTNNRDKQSQRGSNRHENLNKDVSTTSCRGNTCRLITRSPTSLSLEPNRPRTRTSGSISLPKKAGEDDRNEERRTRVSHHDAFTPNPMDM